ncbi:helix-turn-helix transcriptional regulator [Bifidobacterium ruminantium]|uniref:helix-turn-helix domain-containing protein n=1 Tax=Bifidobacterium ruminantium TaxID=78346 RepID=UPI0019585C8A|nr:helix-turn-helix transcriptional regulator [Bifidobacterium ruminantium]MBM6747579.1 helix-turn-helix transcriptional regulator [Bifidobacterium ruminantium]
MTEKQTDDNSIDTEVDIVERAIRYNAQRYLNLLSLSQNDLTGPLGITKGAVSQLLAGNSKLKFRQVYILARTFGVTVEDLMDPTYMLESEELSRQLMQNRSKAKAEYQVRHYGAPDISRRELAVPAGVRYLRKPDGGEAHGTVGPRFFVMPGTNRLALRGPEC